MDYPFFLGLAGTIIALCGRDSQASAIGAVLMIIGGVWMMAQELRERCKVRRR